MSKANSTDQTNPAITITKEVKLTAPKRGVVYGPTTCRDCGEVTGLGQHRCNPSYRDLQSTITALGKENEQLKGYIDGWKAKNTENCEKAALLLCDNVELRAVGAKMRGALEELKVCSGCGMPGKTCSLYKLHTSAIACCPDCKHTKALADSKKGSDV